MKTLLISGCSYGLVYSEMVEELKKLFLVDEVINLSSVGTSPDRQIRVVIEWVAQNGNPDMVIMPVSHYNRFDLPVAGKFDSLHNLHHKANWGIDWLDNAIKQKTINDMIDIDALKTFIKTGAMINQIEHTIHDYLFVKLLTFQAYLQQNKIRHLIFDSGNYYEKLWMEYLSIDNENNSGYQPGMKKRDLIAGCPGIYKFLSFCSNVWMYYQIIDKDNHLIKFNNKNLKDLVSPGNHNEVAIIHHNKEETLKLIEFLIEEKAVYGQ